MTATRRIPGLRRVGLAALLITLSAGIAGATAWSMFQFDAQHTGQTPDVGPGQSVQVPLWDWEADGDPISWSSPVVIDKHVYVASGNTLYCLHADTGQEIWSYPTSGRITSTPAVQILPFGRSKIYVLCGQVPNAPAMGARRLYCLDAGRGRLLWRTEQFGTATEWLWDHQAEWVDSSPVVVDDSKVYVGGRNGYLYCINTSAAYPPLLTDGTIDWSINMIPPAQMYGYIAASPVYYDNKLYIPVAYGAGNAEFYCLNASDGSTRWSYEFDAAFDQAGLGSPMVYGNCVYVGTGETAYDPVNCPQQYAHWCSGYLYKFALDYGPGQGIYPGRVGFGCTVRGTPAMGPDGMLYMTSGKGIYQINPANMDIEWFGVLDIGEETWSSFAAAGTGGNFRLYVGDGGTSGAEGVFCIEPDDGSVIWEYYTGEKTWSSPAIADGKAFFITNSGHLYCFIDQDGPMADRKGAEVGSTAQQSAVTPVTCFALGHARPSPVTSEASIFFDLPIDCDVTLQILDAAGRVVSILHDGAMGAGRHSVQWSGKDASGGELPSGLYFYQMRTQGFTETKKLLLAR